jgi:hypothetical protein
MSTSDPYGVAIGADLRSWWALESADWDSAVAGAEAASLPGGAELWDDMPTVDSKAIARASPLFERYFGIPLDVNLIRRGGYSGIDEAIIDLVPKMQAVVAQRQRQLGD